MLIAALLGFAFGFVDRCSGRSHQLLGSCGLQAARVAGLPRGRRGHRLERLAYLSFGLQRAALLPCLCRAAQPWARRRAADGARHPLHASRAPPEASVRCRVQGRRQQRSFVLGSRSPPHPTLVAIWGAAVTTLHSFHWLRRACRALPFSIGVCLGTPLVLAALGARALPQSLRPDTVSAWCGDGSCWWAWRVFTVRFVMCCRLIEACGAEACAPGEAHAHTAPCWPATLGIWYPRRLPVRGRSALVFYST